MNLFKTAAALTLAGLVTACGSTSKPTTVAEVDYFSGSFAEQRSYALNLMEAAQLSGAKDVKLKDGDSVIDLASSNASFGFVNSLTSGGSLLTAGLSSLAGGLLTPDSKAQYNQVIALIDVTNVSPDIDVDAYGRKAFLRKVGGAFNGIVNNDSGSLSYTTWQGIRRDGFWDNQNPNGHYAIVTTLNGDNGDCRKIESIYLNDLERYGVEINRASFNQNVISHFKGGCGAYFYSLSVKDVVTNKKLPWLTEGSKYLVVTASMSFSNISLNYLSKQNLGVDDLYFYYTSNGANIGKLKDTPYPYIQAPNGKEMYFIKP